MMSSIGGSEIDFHNWQRHFDPDVVAFVMEDTRLSTLQRRLVKEPNATTALRPWRNAAGWHLRELTRPESGAPAAPMV